VASLEVFVAALYNQAALRAAKLFVPENAEIDIFQLDGIPTFNQDDEKAWGALAEYRSVTSDINASILASRLRALFAFMTTPLSHDVVAFQSPRAVTSSPSTNSITR
jgi:hypothetical protein